MLCLYMFYLVCLCFFLGIFSWVRSLVWVCFSFGLCCVLYCDMLPSLCICMFMFVCLFMSLLLGEAGRASLF